MAACLFECSVAVRIRVKSLNAFIRSEFLRRGARRDREDPENGNEPWESKMEVP